jgi:group I intron endonuclease
MNPENKTYYYIYEIINLVNGKTYIGQHITQDLEDGYIGSGKALKSAIKKYGRSSFKKEILAFANGPVSLNFMERCLVPLWWAELPTNYNMMEGGHNGARMSAEARKKISLGRKGKKFGPMPEAQRLAMSERMRGKQPDHLAKLIKENHPRLGKKHTPEARAKMATSQIGQKRPRSEEYCRKISERMKGRVISEETARKIGDANRGKIRTKEQCIKMSGSHRNKKLTEIQRLALRKANVGKRKSQETIEKIRQAKLRPAPDLINEFTGEVVSGLKNRRKFAKDRNLSMCGLYRMIRGETKYCEGWKILKNSSIDNLAVS